MRLEGTNQAGLLVFDLYSFGTQSSQEGFDILRLNLVCAQFVELIERDKPRSMANFDRCTDYLRQFHSIAPEKIASLLLGVRIDREFAQSACLSEQIKNTLAGL
jgi:hypothetical protein